MLLNSLSLIHNSDNVLATVQRFISGAKEDWHFLSSPFQSRDMVRLGFLQVPREWYRI
jgi:hypothetical protein